MTAPDRFGASGRAAVIAATVAALALRLITLPEVSRDGRLLWYDPDSAYHLERVRRTLAGPPPSGAPESGGGFLGVPWFDPMANAPHGFRYHWPPGFDALLAGTAWALGAGAPSTATVAAVGAWMPAVLGALTIPAAAWLAAEAAGPAAAGWAAWALALLPGHVLISMAGRADHHVAETLVWALAAAFALAGLRTNRRRHWIGMGAACASAVWLWPGGQVVAAVLGAGLALEIWLTGASPAGPAAAFAVAALGMLPPIAASPLGRAGAWSYEELSWFHPATAVGGAILVGLAGRRRWAVAAAGAALAALVAWPGALASLREGVGFVLRRDPWIAFTEESEPLFIRGGQFTLTRWMSHLTPPALAFPVLWAWFVRRARGRPGAACFAVWSAAALALMLSQTRFETAGVLPLVVLFGAALAAVTERLGAALAFGVAVLLWAPSGIWLPGTRNNYRMGAPSAGDLELLDFAAGLERAAQPEARGIIMASPWLGHWLETYGGHPVVANSIHTNRDGNMDFARFCLAEDEPAGAARLASRGVRYVVVSEVLLMDVQQAALALGRSAAAFLEPGGDKTIVWKPRGQRLLAARLYLEEGRGLTRFRRLFASTERSEASGRPRHVMYELLPPAGR